MPSLRRLARGLKPRIQDMQIDSVEALRALYASPGPRAAMKALPALDRHGAAFIALSPFLVLATAGADGSLDASPRGGAPGFVKLLDASTLLIPDAPGNNRLDSLGNIVATGRAGLLFMVPGVDETLRVNGRATLSTAPEELERAADERRRPKLVIRITVQQAYLHCAKALMRSKLWQADSRVDRARLPTMGQMLREHTCIDGPVETQAQMLQRYADSL